MNQARYLIHRIGTPLVVATEAGAYVVAGEYWHDTRPGCGAWGPASIATGYTSRDAVHLPDGGEWVPIHVEQESTRAERLAEWEKNILK